MNNQAVNEPPKRPALLVAIALLVMIGCVFLAGGTAVLFAENNPWARAIGSVLLAFPIVIGVTQYFAVFRRNEMATRIAAGVLLFLCATYGVMGLFAALATGAPWLRRVAPLAIAAFLGWAAWNNYEWRFALRAYYKTSPAPPTRWQFSLTEILGATVAVALAAAIASHQIGKLPKPQRPGEGSRNGAADPGLTTGRS